MGIVVSLFACLFTLLGGVLALRLERRRALLLGFGAGAVVGVALFDLVPEALELAGQARGAAAVLAVAGAGYAFYHVVHNAAARAARKGGLGAATLSIHSFLDGLSIGFAFKVSAAVGAVVAIAVVVHDICDGINVVTVVRRNGGDARMARRWLALDAVAPVLGAAAATLVTLRGPELGLALALFGGFFLYIGASDLLPASVAPEPRMGPVLMTLLGMAMVFAAVRLASL
jgi:zinc transporter ZupT